MHHKNVKILTSFNITGRGRALETALDYDENHQTFRQGDTLRYETKIYEIISVEAMLKGDGENRYDVVAFLSKEITPQELLAKVASLKQSPWRKKAEWRQRNRWWLQHWKKVEIIWYCRIKPFFTKK